MADSGVDLGAPSARSLKAVSGARDTFATKPSTLIPRLLRNPLRREYKIYYAAIGHEIGTNMERSQDRFNVSVRPSSRGVRKVLDKRSKLIA